VEQKHRSVWPAPFSLVANLSVIARALFVSAVSAFNLAEEVEDADQVSTRTQQKKTKPCALTMPAAPDTT